MARAKPLRILVSGMIAADPHQGGATWAVLQYILGLRRLGHEVYFVEPIQSSAIQPLGASLLSSINDHYFRQVAQDFGLEESSAILLVGTNQTLGLDYDRLLDLASRCDALINISGMLTDERLLDRIPVRVYLDLDPAFIQLWQAVQGIDMRLAGHTHFVTIGQRIGQRDCDVPTCGVRWIATPQPIVLEYWPAADQVVYPGFTTVGNWRGYGSIEHRGVLYGQKAHSLRNFISLPTRTSIPFMLALAIHADETKDLEALKENRWRLLNPAEVAATPQTYQQFIQQSWAEFGIAKSGYVASRCGWFSDRSIAYLASGRPVLAQDTGFSDFVPCGEGLLRFSSVEEAMSGIESLRSGYTQHSRAAREIACEYFDSDKVLSNLLRSIDL